MTTKLLLSALCLLVIGCAKDNKLPEPKIIPLVIGEDAMRCALLEVCKIPCGKKLCTVPCCADKLKIFDSDFQSSSSK